MKLPDWSLGIPLTVCNCRKKIKGKRDNSRVKSVVQNNATVPFVTWSVPELE